MIYLDSSALVKRYAHEAGSDAIERALSDHPHAATSRLTYPEIISALHRKHRAGEISARALKEAIGAFEADWKRLFIIEFAEELLPTIKLAIRRHAIRGADSVHLATAMWLREELKEEVIFACADVKLLGAARKERLVAFGPG